MRRNRMYMSSWGGLPVFIRRCAVSVIEGMYGCWHPFEIWFEKKIVGTQGTRINSEREGKIRRDLTRSNANMKFKFT